MQIKMIEGATKILGAPKDWEPEHGACAGLPVKEVVTENGVFLVSAWEPTPEEIRLIISGESIKLWIRGPGHPVVALTVGEVP